MVPRDSLSPKDDIGTHRFPRPPPTHTPQIPLRPRGTVVGHPAYNVYDALALTLDVLVAALAASYSLAARPGLKQPRSS